MKDYTQVEIVIPGILIILVTALALFFAIQADRAVERHAAKMKQESIEPALLKQGEYYVETR